MPWRSRIALDVCVGAAVLMIGAVVATRPDIGPAIERTRPYIGDWWRTGALPFGGAAPGRVSEVYPILAKRAQFPPRPARLRQGFLRL